MMKVVLWLSPFVDGLGVGVIAMLLHEFGHLVAAFALGVPIKRIGMKWNKGLYTVRERGEVHQNLLIAIAGPFVNMLMIPVGQGVKLFALANFCYALANMLPIEGSDGYRVAMCWRQLRNGAMEK